MPDLQTGFFLRVRTYTAFLSTGILNLRPAGLDWRHVCSYGFNCHGCPYASYACPVGVMAFGSAVREFPALALATVLAIGVALGRLVCGYACPFGLFQDLMHKLPGPKLKMPRPLRWLKYMLLALLVFLFPYLLGFEPLGYLEAEKPAVKKKDSEILVTLTVRNKGTTPVEGISVIPVYKHNETGVETYRPEQPFEFPEITVPAGEAITLPSITIPNHLNDSNLSVEMPQSRIVQSPRYGLYYCKVCPNGTLTAHLPGYFGDTGESAPAGIYGRAGQNAVRLIVFGTVLVLIVFISRFFCRALCPLGAMYAIASPFALSRVAVNRDSCVGCGICDKVCPVGLDVKDEAGGPECIACGDCISACPKSSIHRQFGLRDSRTIETGLPEGESS